MLNKIINTFSKQKYQFFNVLLHSLIPAFALNEMKVLNNLNYNLLFLIIFSINMLVTRLFSQKYIYIF